jgi:hypothetical protein
MNLEVYRHTIPPIIKQWRLSRPDEPFIEACGNLALSTSCPIIAVCKFMIELEGSTPETEAYLKRLEEFYK